MDTSPEAEKCWFVMRDLKRTNAKNPAYRQLSSEGFEVFTPLIERIQTKGGKRVKEFVPIIHDMLFVNSSKAMLDPIVMRTDTLQYRYVKGAGYCVPLIVPTADMNRFMKAVNSGADVVYYRPEEIKPSMCGSRIRIIGDAPLNGLEGKLLSIPRSKKKRLLIELKGILSAAVEVQPDFIQFL